MTCHECGAQMVDEPTNGEPGYRCTGEGCGILYVPAEFQRDLLDVTRPLPS